MPSSAPSLAHFRAIYELSHECRDLGDDPVGWRRHWYARVATLVGADLVLGGELSGLGTGAPCDLGTADWGWDNGFDQAGWQRALELLREKPTYSPIMSQYAHHFKRHDGIALSAMDFIKEREWVRGIEYQEVYRPLGVYHSLWCCARVPNSPNEVNGQFFCRAKGRRDFNNRYKAILAEASATIAPFVGGALARFREPAPSALAPRARDVLRCLLEGDSDKQIAARLGISKYTVNQYVKVIFGHFGVNTRPELLARWVRRGWGARFAWADDGG